MSKNKTIHHLILWSFALLFLGLLALVTRFLYWFLAKTILTADGLGWPYKAAWIGALGLLVGVNLLRLVNYVVSGIKQGRGK